MLAYCSTLNQFIDDVATGNIAQIIESTFRETFGWRTSPAEFRSWQNSLLALCNILNHPMFPETTGVGVEFQLPKTSKRIDVMLSGFNGQGQREVLIVELKQWATAERTTMDGVVETFVGGSLRHVSHPSYQAWSYAQLLTDFALVVDQQSIAVTACAFLHNMADKSELEIQHYADYTNKAPIFTGLEGYEFQQFIH